MRRLLVGLVVFGLISACSPDSESRLVVAAGTTVVDSGLIDRLASAYEETHPDIQVSVVANPTQLVLELGYQKAADLLITHAPEQEAEFIEAGAAADAARVFESRFVVIGPDEWLETVGGLEAPEVFRIFAADRQVFVSRGDGSGTHDAERLVWLEAGIDPTGEPWYTVVSQGMGPTIIIADQRDGVTLSELGAFLSAKPTVGIIDLQLDPGGLGNPYTAMVVAGSDGEAMAAAFLSWMRSPEGLEEITAANLELFGEIVYEPAATSG